MCQQVQVVHSAARPQWDSNCCAAPDRGRHRDQRQYFEDVRQSPPFRTPRDALLQDDVAAYQRGTAWVPCEHPHEWRSWPVSHASHRRLHHTQRHYFDELPIQASPLRTPRVAAASASLPSQPAKALRRSASAGAGAGAGAGSSKSKCQYSNANLAESALHGRPRLGRPSSERDCGVDGRQQMPVSRSSDWDSNFQALRPDRDAHWTRRRYFNHLLADGRMLLSRAPPLGHENEEETAIAEQKLRRVPTHGSRRGHRPHSAPGGASTIKEKRAKASKSTAAACVGQATSHCVRVHYSFDSMPFDVGTANTCEEIDCLKHELENSDARTCQQNSSGGKLQGSRYVFFGCPSVIEPLAARKTPGECE